VHCSASVTAGAPDTQASDDQSVLERALRGSPVFARHPDPRLLAELVARYSTDNGRDPAWVVEAIAAAGRELAAEESANGEEFTDSYVAIKMIRCLKRRARGQMIPRAEVRKNATPSRDVALIGGLAAEVPSRRTRRRHIREVVLAIAPLTITQENCLPALGLKPRRFLELLKERSIPHIRMGKLRLVEAAVIVAELRRGGTDAGTHHGQKGADLRQIDEPGRPLATVNAS
jgi:hypothetical protein